MTSTKLDDTKGGSDSTDFGGLNALAERDARAAPRSFSISARTVLQMESLGIGADLIDRLFGPRDQIARLSQLDGNLDAEASDRVMRVLRIASLAEKVFDSHAKAMIWLHRENEALGAKPSDLLARESGAAFVEEALLRMEYGVAA